MINVKVKNGDFGLKNLDFWNEQRFLRNDVIIKNIILCVRSDCLDKNIKWKMYLLECHMLGRRRVLLCRSALFLIIARV